MISFCRKMISMNISINERNMNTLLISKIVNILRLFSKAQRKYI